MKTTVNVSGMTCEHCVASVTEELQELAPVTEVSVELHAGEVSPVTITHTGDLEAARIREAVAEAGYDVVDHA